MKTRFFLLGMLIIALLIPFSYAAVGDQYNFTSTQNWTIPANATKIAVHVYGGGGGSGWVDANSNTGSGGGGGGAYALKNVSVRPGQNYTITVGSGGAAGTSGSSATAGGDSWFSNNTFVLAKGGNFSGNTAAGFPSAGGAGGSSASSIGDVVYSGGTGAAGTAAPIGGGGGGGAGSTGAGGNGSGTTAGTGTSLYGGNGGAGSAVDSAGTAGSNYGGGAGGARCDGGCISRNGGAGAPGFVTVTVLEESGVLIIGSNNSVNGSNISGFCALLENVDYSNYQCNATGTQIYWYPNTTVAGESSLYLNLTNATMFNGSYNDSSPNAIMATLNGKTLNTGTLVNQPTLNSSGRYGKAYTFDGTNDYITNSTPITWFTGNGSQTTSMWIMVFGNGSNPSSGLDSFFAQANSAENNRFYILRQQSTGNWLTNIGGTQQTLLSGNSVSYGTWYYITVIRDAANQRQYAYINGIQVINASSTINQTASTVQSFIGSFNNANGNLNGSIDEVRIWNASLSQAEIQAEMNSAYPVRGQNLVASYSFELNNITTGASLNTTADTNYLVNGSSSGEGAYYFDGTNDYLNAGNSSSINIPSGAWSITADVYMLSNSPSLNTRIIHQRTGNNGFLLTQGSGGTSIIANFGNGSSLPSITDTANTINMWYKLAIIYNGTHGLFYQDGNYVAAVFVGTFSPAPTINFTLGGETSSSAYFNGSLSNVRVYPRALDAWEVRDLYNRQSLDFGTYDVTVYNMTGYFNQTQSITWDTTESLTIPTYQALLTLTATQLFTENSITSFNATNNLAFNSTGASSLTIPANTGTNNILVQVLGNYSKNETCTAVSLTTNGTCEFEDIYDNQFTINATNSTGGQLTTWTMTVRNQTLGGTLYQNTTSSAIIYNLLQGYQYNFTLNKSGYNTQSVTLAANASTNNYTFNSSVITLDFTFRDEINQSILNGTNITLSIIDSTGAESTYTTSTGTVSVTDFFPSGDYTFRYGATGYSYRDYYYTLSEADTNFTFYLLSENDYTPGVVEVRNYDGSVVSGAIITLRRYYGNTSTPSIVQMATTQTDGSAVMVAEAVTGFYTWQVEIDGVTRYDTTVPELLAIEADGLWHKTFILDRTGTAVANPNTGFLYAFTPTGTLLNNTAYNLTFSINSSYWNITSCTLTIYNVSNNATLGTNNTFCGDSSVQITTPNTGSIRAVATITTEYFTNTYTFIWPIDSQATSGFTLKDWLDDIEGFSGAGFNNFGRFLIAVLVMVAIVFSLNRTTDLINSGEEILLLITVLILFFSYIDWMNLGIPNLPFEIVNQYGIAFIMSFWTVMSFWRREGVAQ